MTQTEERKAELERIRAELASQNEAFEELRETLEAVGSLELPITTRDLDELFESARDVLRPTKSCRAITGIRC